MRAFHLLFTLCAVAAVGVSANAVNRAPTAPQAVAAAGAAAVAKPADAPSRSADAPRSTTAAASPLQRLGRLAPDLDPGVLALALEARACALRAGDASADARLAVIDYSLPSTEKRLWVFDLAQERLLFREHVAHGQGSGGNRAHAFSNREGSHQTSLGLYRTAETYLGGNGYSLRMDGLDPGFNDAARERAIVMHGAWYANPELIGKQGRLGRSQGCPALREGVARVVIDSLKQQQLLFAYADDAAFLQRGRSFACDGRSAAQILAVARSQPATGGAGISAIAAP